MTKADLETVLQQFSPLKILLGDNGSLLLAEPKEVSLIPDQGIEVVCDATLHWPILGFDLPVALRGLTCVQPIVDKAAKGRSCLVFPLELDHAGVAMLPAMIDHRAAALVNEELQKKPRRALDGTSSKTLSH